MEATLSLCWFTPRWLYFGHIGDSRIYYLPARENAIKQLTHDDTHVGWLLRHGQINEREARSHPRRKRPAKSPPVAPTNSWTHKPARWLAEPGDIFCSARMGWSRVSMIRI